MALNDVQFVFQCCHIVVSYTHLDVYKRQIIRRVRRHIDVIHSVTRCPENRFGEIRNNIFKIEKLHIVR